MNAQPRYMERTHADRILIVDDMSSIHDDFRTILQDSGTSARANALDMSEMATGILGHEGATATARKRMRPAYALSFASQGREGYQSVRRALEENKPYALAFVDMRMPPGWDGLETIRHIREVDSELEIVICTAFADHGWDEIFDQLGAADNVLLLKKPFDPDEVKQMASALTRRWRRQRVLMEQIGSLTQLHMNESDGNDAIADGSDVEGGELSDEATGKLLIDCARDSIRERRRRNRAERHRCVTRLQVDLDEEGRGAFNRSLALTTIDISTSGIAFQSRTFIEPGGIVRFSVPGVKHKPFIIGKIYYCRRDSPATFRIGVKFLDVMDRFDATNKPLE